MLEKLIFLFSLSRAKQADFLHSRGIVLENETSRDAIFYSQVEQDQYFLSYPIPEFPDSFAFRDGCYDIRNASNEKDTTDLLNKKLQLMLQSRIRKFFFGETEDIALPTPINETALREEAEQESFNYIPQNIFKTSEKRFRGLPLSLTDKPLITPITTASSELNPSMKSDFPNSLFDTRTATYIGFNCARSTTHEIRFIIQDPIDNIALVMRGPLGLARGYDEFQYDFRIVRKGEKMSWKTEVIQTCGNPTIIGRDKPLPIALWSCNNVNINKPTEFHLIMNLGEECSHFRITNLMIFPKEGRSSATQQPITPDITVGKLRKRRQFGEFLIPAAIGLIAGISSSGGMSYSMHKKDQEDIQNLQKKVALNEVHEEDYLEAYSKNAHETAIVNNVSQAIISKLHEEQCRFLSKNEHFSTENFLELVIQNFLAEIESTLTAMSIPLPNNPAETLAINLCRSRNPEVHLIKFCAAFYATRVNYQVQAIYFENLEKNISSIVIKLSIRVPLLTSFGAMAIHKMTHLPLPLFVDKNGLFHFQKYDELPTYFANFPGLLNRKVGLDKCDLYDDIFFCDYNTLNELYTNSHVCLNSVLTSSPSCQRTIIKSVSNCLTHFGTNYLILSHVGKADVNVVNDNIYHNIQLFNSMKAPALQQSNVTFISSEEILQIDCHLASFRFVGSKGKQMYATHKSVGNISATFPLQLNEIDDYDNFKKSDKEIDELIDQLDKLDDEHMKQTLELAKRRNAGEAGVLLNMNPEEYEMWREFGLPFGLGIVSVLLTLVIGCLIVRKIKKKWTQTRFVGNEQGDARMLSSPIVETRQ